MLKVFCAPARYVQGHDATMALASELSRLGIAGKALIIASPTARRALEPVWRETFQAAGLDYAILDFGGGMLLCGDCPRRGRGAPRLGLVDRRRRRRQDIGRRPRRRRGT